jgi:hypothetical protein
LCSTVFVAATMYGTNPKSCSGTTLLVIHEW